MKHGTWVVVADGRKMLVLHNQGDAEIMDLRVIAEREEKAPPTSELGTQRPGRTHESMTTGRSAMQESDWHQLAEDGFARDVAEQINKAARAGKFKEIVLVAPPKALAEIRTHLHKEAQARVIAERDKDLTGHTVEHIQKLLADI